MKTRSRYETLAAQEAKHWGNVVPDPENPQIWDDDRIFELFFGKEYKNLIELAAASGPKILELGCGEGNLAMELARRRLRVTGIDLSPERIRRARSKVRRAGLMRLAAFTVGDLNTIKLRRNAFDGVVANGSLHHIARLDHLLDEVHKTLKPGGYVIVFDFIGMGRLRRVLGAFLYAVLPTHKSYRAKWALRKKLRSFLATEAEKRLGLAGESSNVLHPESPFEEISQKSIVTEIGKRFEILSLSTHLPFWFYLVAKIRFPGAVKYTAAEVFRFMDHLLVRSGISEGAYVFLLARRT